MRIVVLFVLAALAAAPSHAQPPGPGLKTGQLEVKAFQAIPKTKTAVQLTSDTSLARKLRGEVMEHLARRGNQVGFSGGNVMRMDVSYFDLSGGNGRRRLHQRRPELPRARLQSAHGPAAQQVRAPRQLHAARHRADTAHLAHSLLGRDRQGAVVRQRLVHHRKATMPSSPAAT